MNITVIRLFLASRSSGAFTIAVEQKAFEEGIERLMRGLMSRARSSFEV